MPKIVLPSDVSQENIEHSVTVSLHEEIERVPCWPCHRLDDDQSTYVPNKDGNGAACISDIGAEVIVATARQLLRQDEMLPAAR